MSTHADLLRRHSPEESARRAAEDLSRAHLLRKIERLRAEKHHYQLLLLAAALTLSVVGANFGLLVWMAK